MREVTIKLETINDVKNFVSAVTKFECDFDIAADISKPLSLQINTDDEKEIGDVLKAISAVIVSE